MKSNLLQYYLNWNVKCYVLIILGISCLIVYVQQEYIIVPQIHNMLAVDIKTKEWLLSKFGEYRFASFVLTPLVILLRIYLVSICFYIGNILLERVHKTTTWKTYFHVSLNPFLHTESGNNLEVEPKSMQSPPLKRHENKSSK